MTWNPKGFSDESIEPPETSDNSLSSTLDYFNKPKFRVKFNGSCLTTDSVFTAEKNSKYIYCLWSKIMGVL